MTQSIILLTTLAVMAGLGVGYWYGWMLDPKRIHMMVIAYVVSLGTLVAATDDSCDELKAMLKGEPA